MNTYYTLLTKVGAAQLVNAQAFGESLPITHIAIGDGAGAAVTPVESMTALVREVHRVPVSSLMPDVDNPSWLVIEAVVPSTVGGWTIREIGLIGGENQLLAVGNFPDTYKPVVAEGAAKDLVIRMIVQVSSAAGATLSVNSSVAVATTASVATAVSAHEKHADPHSQYLTAARGDARYRLKSDTLAAADIWFAGAAAPALPAEGVLRVHNFGASAATLTIDATPCQPSKVAVAIANLGGYTTVESSGGVRINFPVSTNGQPYTYATLSSNAVQQGVWSGATYGRAVYLGTAYSSLGAIENGALMSVDVGAGVAIVCVVSGGAAPFFQLQAVRLATGERGPVTAYTGASQLGGLAGAWKVATGRVLLIGAAFAVCATVAADLSIKFGETFRGVGPYADAYGLFSSSTRLSSSSVLCAGAAAGNGVVRCQVLTVDESGLITSSRIVDGPQAGNGLPQLEAASPSSAIYAGSNGVLGISISGGAPVLAEEFVMPAGSIAAGNLAPTIAGVTSAGHYAIAYYDESSRSSYRFAVVSATGGSVTWGAAAVVTESISWGQRLSGRAKFTLYPDCWSQTYGGPGQKVFQTAPDAFLVANAKLIGFSVSGTAVTAGAAVNQAGTATTVTRLPDGVWVYSDAQANVTRRFTQAGAVITPGDVLFSAYASTLTGLGINYFAGRIKAGLAYHNYQTVENLCLPLSGGGTGLGIGTKVSPPNIFLLMDKIV